MKEYTKSFRKIIPHLRSVALEAVELCPLRGEKMEIPGGNEAVEVYFHRAASTPGAVLFEMHGGGFVLGHAAKNDALRELIKNELDIHVIGINYRKAPEHPYPAAIEDVLAVMGYFAAHAKEYGIDPGSFALMGYSAGANLATVACMKAREETAYRIACQILHYPYLDAVTEPDNKAKYPADIPCEVIDAFNDLYCREEERGLPFVSPVTAPGQLLAGMPPAVVLTAKEDALSKEGLLYADMLREAGVAVEAREVEYAHHGYIEDYYNKAWYKTIPEDTKASYRENFGDAAEEAIHITLEQLRKYLK
ncbi:MAG TPA: alpha/beta hydrolase [Clostridiales bacterium]|nr:alpha/beta hydrolase [Clostridiales bacterium]